MNHCKRPCAEAKLSKCFLIIGKGGERKDTLKRSSKLEKGLKSFKLALKALKRPSRLPRPVRIPLRAFWALISLKG